MKDPSIRYKAVRGSDHSDEEQAGAGAFRSGDDPSSDDTPRFSSTHAPIHDTQSEAAASGVAVMEGKAFLERQDSDEYAPGPIQRRCGARAMAYATAGLVLSLVLVVACLSQTLGLWASQPSSWQQPPSNLTSQVQSEPDAHEASPKSSHLVDYTWDGKKCFESNAELRVAIDSYLLDRNNATLQEVYGLPIGAWCVRHIRDFAFAFAAEGRKFAFPDRADELRTLMERFNDDISTWDVTGAKSLNRMFRGAKEFNQDLSKWDVSRVESMLGTFEFTQRFDADIRNWDVSKVKIFTAMFYEAEGFGRNLVYWNVSSATDMVSMFRNAPRFDHDMCPWAKLLEANNVSSMQVRGMFMNSGCPIDTMVGPFFGDDPRWSQPGPFCHNCQ